MPNSRMSNRLMPNNLMPNSIMPNSLMPNLRSSKILKLTQQISIFKISINGKSLFTNILRLAKFDFLKLTKKFKNWQNLI